ncbi:MAG TPA: MoaD/ThiS family protein [Candidatus Nanoarchaeia archaeon]|nr:MoaD/ThiS family protein [Candidatus Nanoarchaeia archaeon]
MKIKAFIERENKTKEITLKENSKIIDLLKELKINQTSVFITKNNEIVIEDEKLEDKDEIKILSVISGG